VQTIVVSGSQLSHSNWTVTWLIAKSHDRTSLAELAVVEDDVRREGVRAGADRPHVEVVHVDHAVDAADSSAHLGDLEVARDALQQHVGRLAHDAQHADDDDRRDQQREQRVDPGRAGQHDHRAADDDADRAEHVARDVHQRGADVEVSLRAARQRQPDRDVDRQADRRDPGHQRAGRQLRVHEALDRLDRDQDRDRGEQRSVGERREDLVARETVGLPLRRRTPRLDRGGQRDTERDDVHHDVRRVREQRERTSLDAADALEHRHRGGCDQRDP
jgi:hypothetical protein